MIPKTLQASLPYSIKDKNETKRKRQSYLQKRAVVMEKKEKMVTSLMQAINTIKNEKEMKKKKKATTQRAQFLKKKTDIEDAKAINRKKKSKQYFALHGSQNTEVDSGEHKAKRFKK